MHCGKKVALRVCHGGGAAQVDSDTFHFWGKKLSGMRTGAMLSKKVARNAYRGNVIKKRFFFWDVVPKIAKSNYVWVSEDIF